MTALPFERGVRKRHRLPDATGGPSASAVPDATGDISTSVGSGATGDMPTSGLFGPRLCDLGLPRPRHARLVVPQGDVRLLAANTARAWSTRLHLHCTSQQQLLLLAALFRYKTHSRTYSA